MFFSAAVEHRTICKQKKSDLEAKVARCAATKAKPLTDEDEEILKFSLAELVTECSSKSLSPAAVLDVYVKRCLAAHARTNCLADLMVDEALAHYAPDRPLSGIPISLKDCIDIAGHDSTIGYSSRANRPVPTSAPLVRLLQDAGALLHVKTTVPTGLLSFETTSDLFGTTTNPYNSKFSPGASTGGGAALLAYRGSKIEIGTDVGGSVRFPAAYCGLYGMKASSGRLPNGGCQTSVPGLEGFQATSPIAKNLDDLREFWERVIGMKPWEYDQSCVPVPWRPVDFVLAGRKPRWGVMWDDGFMPPTPACARALRIAMNALQLRGYEVVNFDAPSPLEGLKIGFPLAFADGGASLTAPLSPSESINPAIRLLITLCSVPSFVRRGVAACLRWVSRPAGRNDAYADIIECFRPVTGTEERELVVRRNAYRDAWAQAMHKQDVDFLLTVPHALPPIPKDGTATATLLCANYAFLYNILDYTAGIIPVTFVSRTEDALPLNFENSETWHGMHDPARAAWSLYDAEEMDGLPLGVQVVGSRYQEEKVLEGMRLLDVALRESGQPFVQKEF